MKGGAGTGYDFRLGGRSNDAEWYGLHRVTQPTCTQLDKISKRDLGIVNMRINKRPLREIAREFGISKTRVSQILDHWSRRGAEFCGYKGYEVA